MALINIGSDFKPGMLEQTMHWQVIWPRVIAKAWEDLEFKAELLKDPTGTINKYFDYQLSEELDLTIIDSPASTPEFDIDKAFNKNGDPWRDLPKLKLTIALPPAPKLEHQAIAITAYLDTARTYPFTCC